MTFRARLAGAFAALVLVVLAGAWLVIRGEMSRRLEAQFRVRVGGAVRAARAELRAEHESVAERLAGLAGALRDDTRFRLGLSGAGGDAAGYVRDWAGSAMAAAGLDALVLTDSTGVILTSGHFRNTFGQRLGGLPAVLRDVGGPALVRLRVPDGALLSLAALDSTAFGGRRVYLIGGERVDHAFLARLPGPDDGVVILETPAGDTRPAPLPDPGLTAEVRVPFADATVEPPAVASARFTIGYSLAPLAALRHSLDRWLLAAGGAAVLVAALAGWWLAGRLARPVHALAGAAERMELDRPRRFPGVARADEIGVLARALDEMTGRIQGAAARLRDAERRVAVGDVARQVNHDVKNGLVPIRNVVRHLAETAERDPARLAAVFRERRGTLEGALEYLDRLAGTYARLTPALGRGSADLNALVRQATDGQPHVVLELADALPPVRGDATAIRRVVDNLVRNALDAAARAEVRTAMRDGAVRLTVRDDGPGMTREQLDRAFAGFYTTKPEGTGLGLTVVRRLVQDLDGSLRIETEPGRGTRVTVDLPPYRRTDAPSGGVAGAGA